MISFSAVFVKLAHVGPTMTAFYRMFFGGIILLLIVLIRRERLWGGVSTLALIGVCAVAFAFDLSFWHRSIDYIGPGLATILANFQVLFMAGFGAIILKERLGLRSIVAIPLAMLGLFMVFGIKWDQFESSYKIGVAFGLVTALCYAVFLLVLKKLQTSHKSVSPAANIAVISLCCALFLAVEGYFQGESFYIPDLQSWSSLIAYGLFGQVLGWVLISRAIPHLEASRIGIVLLLQPTLSFLWDILFFNRATEPLEYVGVTLALVAIYLGAIGKKK